MAQIGDFVWSDGMIASIDKVREFPTALYKKCHNMKLSQIKLSPF
jgi:hypothetical protein